MAVVNVLTGEGFEREVLGISHVDINVKRLPKHNKKLNFFETVEMVKTIQGVYDWNPKIPKTKISKELFEIIRSLLKKGLGEKLRIFVSVGTRLDLHFGTDCFFELNGSVVTVDLTISNKKNDIKANILIRPVDIYNRQFHVAK
jgi:hypothetical protein